MESLKEAEVWVAVGFGRMIARLVGKGVPGMVGKKLDQRAAVISAELDEAKRLRAEAAALLADYKKRAAGAEADARAIVDAATAEAAQFQKDSRIALEPQVQRRAAAAQDPEAEAEAAAQNEIRGLAADSAVNAAQKLSAARLDDRRASGLITDSSKRLGDKRN